MTQKVNKHALIATALICLALIGGILGVTAVNMLESPKPIISSQEQALNANQALMQYFFDNGYVTEYPAYFGGCYIDEANYYHICLNSPAEQEMKILESILSAYKNVIIYEHCEYSQAELQEYANQIANELLGEGYKLTKWYVDTAANSIVIGVLSEDVVSVNEWIANHRTSNTLPRVTVVEGSYIAFD